MHRTDICDRLGFVFPGLFARADGPLLVGQASVLPSVHTLHRGGTYRYAAAPVSPPFVFIFAPTLVLRPVLRLPARLPDGAAQ